MGGPLLVRPRPLDGEGLRGYFLRLAEANALLPNIDLFRRCFGGITLVGITNARLELVAGEFGLDPHALVKLGCRGMVKDPTRCHYLGHRISAQHLRGAQCAVCPQCLSTCPAVRADWELVAQVVCPEHGCWLVDQCTGCRRSICWKRAAVRTCFCGQDLARIETRPANPGAIEYGRMVARRLFGDLEPVDEPRPAFRALGAAPLNQLLCIFNLLRNSRFQGLAGSAPKLPVWSARLREQVAAVMGVGTVLADWPRQWHRALERVSGSDFLQSRPRRQIVSVEQARAPFVALQRTKWSPGAEFPQAFRAELAKFLSERSVRVGSRRYYTLGPRLNLKAASPTQLSHLWSVGADGTAISADDLLSAEAVRDLFDASVDQMLALQRVGILPEDREWFTAREVDEGFKRLTCWTRSRSRLGSEELVALWDVGLCNSAELEIELQRVMTGETPTVTWLHIRPAGLGNLFVRKQLGSGSGPESEGAGGVG